MMPRANQSTEPLPRAMAILSTLCLIVLLIGCKTRVLVLPESQAVSRVEAGKPFTPALPGYYVPDARMREILLQLQGKVETAEAK
jgi:hypothetical protein